MSFTYPFRPGYTFYSGTTFAGADNPPNTVAINERIYSIDLAGYRHASLPSFRQGVVTSGELSDQLFNPDGGWWRYRFNWNLGAGQELVDLDDDTIGARYFSSTGVNNWEQNQLTLHKSFGSLQEVSTGQHIAGTIAKYNNELVAITGPTANMFRFDPTTDSWLSTGWVSNVSWASHPSSTSIGAGDVTGFFIYESSVTTNTFYYADNADGAVYKHVYSGSSTWTTVHSGATDLSNSNLGLYGNNLLFCDGNKIYEVLAGGTSDLIYTQNSGDFVFTSIFATGSRIYFAGHDNNRSYLYATTTTSTGRLAVAQQVANLPDGELIKQAAGYAGNIVLLTNKGLRFATVTGDGSITYGPLFGDNQSNPTYVRDITSFDLIKNELRFIWNESTAGDIGIGRANLEDFVGTLQPSFADEQVVSLGAGNAAQLLWLEYVDTSGLIDTYEYITFIRNGDDIARTSTNYVLQGTLQTGDIFFGTAEPKSLGQIELRFDPLAVGQSVKAEVFDGDSNDSLVSQTISALGANELKISPSGNVFNRCYMVITLGSNGGSTPRLTQWKMRSYPIAPTVQQWNVPLMINGSVLHGDGQGQIKSQNPWTELTFLRDTWESRTIVVYKEGVHTYRVRISDFLVEPTKWDDAGQWLEAKVTVQLISVE